MSPGLCQIAAPYWILGLITDVYSLLAYLNDVPQVIRAMPGAKGLHTERSEVMGLLKEFRPPHVRSYEARYLSVGIE